MHGAAFWLQQVAIKYYLQTTLGGTFKTNKAKCHDGCHLQSSKNKLEQTDKRKTALADNAYISLKRIDLIHVLVKIVTIDRSIFLHGTSSRHRSIALGTVSRPK